MNTNRTNLDAATAAYMAYDAAMRVAPTDPVARLTYERAAYALAVRTANEALAAK